MSKEKKSDKQRIYDLERRVRALEKMVERNAGTLGGLESREERRSYNERACDPCCGP